MKRSTEEITQEVYRAITENGPMSLTELKNTIGNVTRERIRKIVEAKTDVFEAVGSLLQPGVPPQHLWGLTGMRQELLPDPEKKHPFDLPKHSVIHREIMKQQRIRYDRY